jgi:hypothetical protein
LKGTEHRPHHYHHHHLLGEKYQKHCKKTLTRSFGIHASGHPEVHLCIDYKLKTFLPSDTALAEHRSSAVGNATHQSTGMYFLHWKNKGLQLLLLQSALPLTALESNKCSHRKNLMTFYKRIALERSQNWAPVAHTCDPSYLGDK